MLPQVQYRHASVLSAADKHLSFGFGHCLLSLRCESCTDQVPHQAKRIAATSRPILYPAERSLCAHPKSFIAASPPGSLRCSVQVVLVGSSVSCSLVFAEPSVHPCNAVFLVCQPAAAPLRTATLCAATLIPHQCSPLSAILFPHTAAVQVQSSAQHWAIRDSAALPRSPPSAAPCCWFAVRRQCRLAVFPCRVRGAAWRPHAGCGAAVCRKEPRPPSFPGSPNLPPLLRRRPAAPPLPRCAAARGALRCWPRCATLAAPAAPVGSRPRTTAPATRTAAPAPGSVVNEWVQRCEATRCCAGNCVRYFKGRQSQRM